MNSGSTERRKKDSLWMNLDRRFPLLVFGAAIAVIVLRRPDAILNPQFWREGAAMANTIIRSLSINRQRV